MTWRKKIPPSSELWRDFSLYRGKKAYILAPAILSGVCRRFACSGQIAIASALVIRRIGTVIHFHFIVDYVGDVAQFEKEFNDDLAVIAHAIKSYGLPENLKVSVHSGSDKFSLYPIIRRALQR